LGDFLGNFALSLGNFLTETSGHPELNLKVSTSFLLQKGNVTKRVASLASKEVLPIVSEKTQLQKNRLFNYEINIFMVSVKGCI
jgi:hypothetical protein